MIRHSEILIALGRTQCLVDDFANSSIGVNLYTTRIYFVTEG